MVRYRLSRQCECVYCQPQVWEFWWEGGGVVGTQVPEHPHQDHIPDPIDRLDFLLYELSICPLSGLNKVLVLAPA